MIVDSSIPFDTARIGAAAVYCSDGRYGEQMDQFLHVSLGLPRYDRLAVPGGIAPLAGHLIAWREEEALAQQLRFLIESHALTRLVLIAHQDCGFYVHRLGYRVLEREQQQCLDLVKCAQRIRSFASHLRVEAYFARVSDSTVFFEPVDIG
jgi:hypothetical protein